MKRTFTHRSTRASVSTGSTHRGSVVEGFREKSLVLDAAIREYAKLKRDGISVDLSEFCDRFPDYRKSLRRLIEVQDLLPPLELLGEEKWPEIGGLFLGYEIQELLGAGSIARVYLASDLQLGGRFVAIKVSRHGSYEAETLGKLDHPNIVQVYSVSHDADSDLTIVCMPYRGSATLSDVLDAGYRDRKPPCRAQVILNVASAMAIEDALPDGELTREEPADVLRRGSFVDGAVHVGMQLASALQYAHQHGVLHRDLKPSNVLLSPNGRPLVLDFNLSFDEDLNVVHHGGTLPYAAPEQLREAGLEVQPAESEVDARADVFSLGVILYELLTGKLPFGTPHSNLGPRRAIQWQLQAQEAPPAPPNELNAQISRPLANIIQRCLERDPGRRFPTMADLEATLHKYFGSRQRTVRWMRRHPLINVAIAAFVLCAASSLVYWASLPPYVERMYARGLHELRDGDARQAIDFLNLAIQKDPSRESALFLRGVAFQKLNDHERAVADLRQVKELQTEALLWDHLGYSYFHLQRPQEAYVAYMRACTLDPAYELRLKKAYMAFEWRKDGTAAIDLSQAIERDPGRYEAYLLRAAIVFQARKSNGANELDAAVRDIQVACQRQRNSLAVEYQAARILAVASLRQPDLKEQARIHLTEAVRLGLSRDAIEDNAQLEPLRKENWYGPLLAECKPPGVATKPTLAEIAMTPPGSYPGNADAAELPLLNRSYSPSP